MSHSPLGVFDSGVGGLSVLREIRTLLPAENLLYVADSGFAPYGPKPAAFVQERSLRISRFLIEQGAKAIVIACNTATAAAAPLLRSTFSLPIVAMEPAVKPAVASTKSGVIGVLATAGTLGSAQFNNLVGRFGTQVKIVVQACPGWVEAVEAGKLDGDETRTLVASFTSPLLAAGADTLVLGCTHYPFLRSLISEVVGADVTLIDSGQAVARQVQRVLTENGTLNQSNHAGSETFWTTGDERSQKMLATLWGGSGDFYASHGVNL